MGKSNIKNIFRAECGQLLGEFLILVPGQFHLGMEKYKARWHFSGSRIVWVVLGSYGFGLVLIMEGAGK